jgi:hypothetical protein
MNQIPIHKSTDSEDFRTIDVRGRVTIFTRSSGTRTYHDIREDYSLEVITSNNIKELISSHAIHVYETVSYYDIRMQNSDDKRYLNNPKSIIETKCTCGYGLKPIDNGFKHQALIECQCEHCRAKIFVQIPHKRNY